MIKLKIQKLSLAAVLAGLLWPSSSTLAQDTVTIPKSRLEELEKKAAELDRLKGDLNQTKAENLKLQKKNQEAAAKLATLPTIAPTTNTSPTVAALPPLTPGDIVEAEDLANHFKFEREAAEPRFVNQKFRVRGVVSGFEKPPFVRTYKVLLKTADPRQVIACSLSPEDRYSAVFPVKNGTELRGLTSGAPVTLLRLGDRVVVEGRCNGGSDSGVAITGFKLDRTP